MRGHTKERFSSDSGQAMHLAPLVLLERATQVCRAIILNSIVWRFPVCERCSDNARKVTTASKSTGHGGASINTQETLGIESNQNNIRIESNADPSFLFTFPCFDAGYLWYRAVSLAAEVYGHPPD